MCQDDGSWPPGGFALSTPLQVYELAQGPKLFRDAQDMQLTDQSGQACGFIVFGHSLVIARKPYQRFMLLPVVDKVRNGSQFLRPLPVILRVPASHIASTRRARHWLVP